MTLTDLELKAIKERATQSPGMTHYPGCAVEHQACAIHALLGELERARAANNTLTNVLAGTVCSRCENRIGYTGATIKYGDWRSCPSCAPARAALSGKEAK